MSSSKLKSKALLALAALTASTSTVFLSPLLGDSAAYGAPNCSENTSTMTYTGGQFCIGSDGSTGNNEEGGQDQSYLLEVGEYYVGLGGQTNFPCPGDRTSNNVEGGCGLSTSVQAVYGGKPDFPALGYYYIAGGAESSLEGQYSSPYCFGYAQGLDFVQGLGLDDAGPNPSQAPAYTGSPAPLLAIDIEQNDAFGWASGSAANNRSDFDGFGDAVGGFASADNSCPNAASQNLGYELVVYSAPAQWSYSFGTGTEAAIPNQPLWSYENEPGGDQQNFSDADFSWSPSSPQLAWQFSQNSDYDDINMYACLPYYNYSLRLNSSTDCSSEGGYGY